MSRLFSVIITLAGMTVLLSFTSPAQAASLSILKGAYSFGTKNIFYATAYAQNFRKRPWDIEPAAGDSGDDTALLSDITYYPKESDDLRAIAISYDEANGTTLAQNSASIVLFATVPLQP